MSTITASIKKVKAVETSSSHVSGNYTYIDYLRVLATLFVIFWHCLSDVYYKFGPINEWMPASIAFGLGVRWTVPCFVMISGALLLGKAEDAVTFYKKRFVRILIPVVVWAIVYALIRLYVFKTYTYNTQPEPSLIDFLFKDQLKSLLHNNLVYHLYFISIILGLYLVTPFLSHAVRNISKRDLEIFLLLGIGIYSVKHFFPSLIIVNDFSISANIIYFVLGYYLHRYELTKKIRTAIYGLGILMVVIMSYQNYQLEYVLGNHGDTYYQYNGLFVMTLAATTFVLFKYFPYYSKFRSLNNRMQIVSAYTFGMYIAHPLFISFLLYNHFVLLTMSPWESKLHLPLIDIDILFKSHGVLGAFCMSVVIFILLTFVFYLLKKAKVLKYFS